MTVLGRLPSEDAFDLCFSLDQAIWRAISSPDRSKAVREFLELKRPERRKEVANFRDGSVHGFQPFVIPEAFLRECANESRYAEFFTQLAAEKDFDVISCETEDCRTFRVDPITIPKPTSIAEHWLVSSEISPAIIAYAMRLRIRKEYGFEFNAACVRLFRTYCDFLNAHLSAKNIQEPDLLIGELVRVSREEFGADDEFANSEAEVTPPLQRSADGFVHACRLCGYISYERLEKVIFHTKQFDFHFILSAIFGFPTEIAGFDDLFGGGGLFLNDSAGRSQRPGRSILIKGRFGTGKSLLQLQIAASVARKGGVAWINAFEQSSAELLFSLESVGGTPPLSEAAIATSVEAAKKHLREKDGRGLLVIVGGANSDISLLLQQLEADSETISSKELQLLCVDPLSSVQFSRGESNAEHRRQQLYQALDSLKTRGVNVLMIAEDGQTKDREAWLEENIFDTVIRTTESHDHGSSRRFLEVQKSRLQREQPGRHAYELIPGKGFHIYPSSAAVDAKIVHRKILHPSDQAEIDFGLEQLNELLGENGVVQGDVIALRGDTGSLKTQLGLTFLTIRDRHWLSKRASLLIAARESSEALEFQLRQPWYHATKDRMQRSGKQTKQISDFIIHSLPLGHILPGQIFSQLESSFDEAAAKRKSIDRVMITNIAHWEMSCPFIREDVTFADTLVNFLRKRRVTSLFVCGNEFFDSNVQRPIVDYADCVLKFDRHTDVVSGKRTVTFRVIKSRRMNHNRGEHTIELSDQQGIYVPG
ncbi:MAG: ATPase domain-containing protein [Planctomycetota bacterium]